ncbi:MULTISPECIES: sugar ABC transporter permease [Bacteria]
MSASDPARRPLSAAADRVRDGTTGVIDRARTGDLGVVPVVLGLAIIWTIFQILNPVFLSSSNLVNLTLQCAAIGTITLGVVIVLLVGEIDLSVGSVSGLSAAMLAVAMVQARWPVIAAVLAGMLAGTAVGLLYGFLYTRFGIPSFVITLAGLLGILGVQLWVLGEEGSINLPFDSWLVVFAQQMFLPPWASYAVILLAVAGNAWARLRTARRRERANLTYQSTRSIAVRALLLLAGLGAAAWYLNLSRGVGFSFLLFVLLIAVADFALTRTRWGRAVYAVGGSVEAARRAGIRVDRIYLSAFVLCSTLAATGGILAAARLGAVSQSSGTADTNLNAIAAAVIGGASLFGGRGTAWAALLGILVIQSISSGLTLLSLDSSVRFVVTGVVLVLAVILDSTSRKSRATHGRN